MNRALAEETPFFDLTLDLDPQEQREADLLEFGDADEALDPDYADWCQPARLQSEFADPDLGAKYLRSLGEYDHESDDDEIEKAIHSAIYLNEKQLENRHDRIMVDVPRDGRRIGGTHGLPPEKRRTCYAKIVNEQLLRWNCSDQENAEHEEWRIAGNAKYKRELSYCLSIYKGKYRAVLELMADLKTVPEIAKIVGKTARRIQQIVHGNAQKGRKAKPGLEQICREIVAAGVPVDFQSPPPVIVDQPVPVIVQPVHTRRKSLQKQAVLGQLGWDFDALEMGVAA